MRQDDAQEIGSWLMVLIVGGYVGWLVLKIAGVL